MLNIYKVRTKEHQVVDSCAADEISACKYCFIVNIALILGNYKKIKTEQIN